MFDSGNPGFDAVTRALTMLALVPVFLLGIYILVRALFFFALWIPASSGQKMAKVTALRVTFGWNRLCKGLGLYETVERTRFKDGKVEKKKKVPKMSIRTDDYGVFVYVKTVPKVGFDELQKYRDHFANSWGCRRVAIHQVKPGKILIRGVRVDPLTTPIDYSEPSKIEKHSIWHLGLDEWANETQIDFGNVPGVTIAGLPGYGKTALVNRGLMRWMKSSKIQIAAIDGKQGGDYDDASPRLFRHLGDDMFEARDFLHELNEHRKQRSRQLRSLFGTKSIWNVPGKGKNGSTGPGFTEEFPLIICVIDEANTFFRMVRDGGDKKLKELNSAAAENITNVEDLVKKGRSVGIVTILLTQKPTGDAIPTPIRDNCPVTGSFALRTSDAAVAALGEDIKNYPDASPLNLLADEYRLVMTLARQDLAGFKRVRTTYVPDELIAQTANDTSHYQQDPIKTLEMVGQ